MNHFKQHTTPAIVIGLDCMTGLQTARILARHKIPVLAIAKDPEHYCCRTRVCERILYADTASTDLVTALLNLAPQLREKAVLFPCTDMSVLTISRHRDRLAQWYHVVLPDADVVEMLMDKIRFTRFALDKQLPIPKTYLLYGKNDARDAAEALDYPCILKPPVKTPEWEKNAKTKVFKVNSARDLLELYDRASQWAEVLIAQQWVEGGDDTLYSCNVYFNAGNRPLVTFVARKLRQWPPGIGTSCLGEECRNDVVLQETVRLFETAGYRGLGYVEIKRDARTGEHFIIEPNIGRPTGRSAISEAGGVELLYTKYCDVLGLPLRENRVQTYGGVKWIYLRRDLQSAHFYWKRGELTLRQWWRSIRGRKGYALFSWRDPMPFLADFVRAFGLALGKRRGANSAPAAEAKPRPEPAQVTQ